MKAEELKGIDYRQGLERFSNNDKLYERFLIKFAAGDEVAKAGALLESGDIDGAYAVVHTLKGTSGNLSIERLFKACSEFTKEYKAGNYRKLQLLFEIIEAESESISEQIKQLDNYSNLHGESNERNEQ